MMKKMAYLSVLTSLISASVISLDLGVFQLSIFRVIIILMVFAMIVRMLKTNEKVSLKENSENRYSISVMLIWLVYSVMTLGWVKDYGGWFKAVYFIALGFMCIIIFSKIFKKSDDILTCFRILSVMIIIHNIIGWYEISTGNYMFMTAERSLKFARYNNPVSIFYNTNDFATFLFMSIFITYVCAVNSKKVIGKCVFIGTMISSTYLLIMTGSRANILGIILAFIVFVYLSMRNKRGRRTILIILISLFGFILLMPIALNNLFLLINQNLYFRFSADVSSDVARINLIKNGFTFLINTFGFGTGAGNIEYWMDNYGTYNTFGLTNMHNWWMEILTGYGIIVFLLYITFYIKLFQSLYRKYKISKDKIDTSISLCIMCCLAGFTIGATSSSSNISSEWLWVFFGISIVYQGISSKAK